MPPRAPAPIVLLRSLSRCGDGLGSARVNSKDEVALLLGRAQICPNECHPFPGRVCVYHLLGKTVFAGLVHLIDTVCRPTSNFSRGTHSAARHSSLRPSRGDAAVRQKLLEQADAVPLVSRKLPTAVRRHLAFDGLPVWAPRFRDPQDGHSIAGAAIAHWRSRASFVISSSLRDSTSGTSWSPFSPTGNHSSLHI